MQVATVPTRFPDDLIPEEADVLQRVAAMPVDLPSMAAVANIWRAAQAARAYLEREVLRPRDLSWAGFSLLFNLWVWGSMETRALARSMGCARPTVTGVAAARRAFPAWAALGREGRREVLTRFADAIDAAVPDLAKVETADNGSLYEAMRLRVLPRAASNIRFFADYAVQRLPEAEAPRTLPGGERNTVRFEPAGVTAVSTPWNAPLMLATWRVGPALAAG